MIYALAERLVPRLSAVLTAGNIACANRSCAGRARPWNRIVPSGLRANGEWFCSAKCLEQVILRECLTQHLQAPSTARMRLGMVLLEKGIIGERDLRSALRAQHPSSANGRERIGEYLRRCGRLTARELAIALAAQWQCPAVHRATGVPPEAARIPLAIMRQCRAVPLLSSAAGHVLHVAFDGPPDHSLLYAIGRMLDCRTEPCITEPEIIDEMLTSVADHARDIEINFGEARSAETIAHSARSYVEHIAGGEIAFVSCPGFFWMRIPREPIALHLVFLKTIRGADDKVT